MLDEEAAPQEPVAEQPSEEAGLANAVDERASELTGGEGAAATEAPVADNSGAVAQAEAHLDDADLADDRETLKALQKKL